MIVSNESTACARCGAIRPGTTPAAWFPTACWQAWDAASPGAPSLCGASHSIVRGSRRSGLSRRTCQRSVITYTGTLPEDSEVPVVLQARSFTVSVAGAFNAVTIMPAGIVAPA